MNWIPPVENPPDRSSERKQPVPARKKVSVRPIRTESGGSASTLEAEVETWVNEGGAGDEPGNASPLSADDK